MCLLNNHCRPNVYSKTTGLTSPNITVSFLFESLFCPMSNKVSDRGEEKCCGRLAVLWRPALTWWSPFPVKIPPATCGRLKKNHAFPPVARVGLELPSRTSHVSAPKVKSFTSYKSSHALKQNCI